MLLTLISTYMQNIIWILLVHNLFLAANVCKYTVRYAVRLPISNNCWKFGEYLMSGCWDMGISNVVICRPAGGFK